MRRIKQRSTIYISGLAFEGVVLDDNRYAIAFNQLKVLRLIPYNYTLKQLAEVLGTIISPETVETFPGETVEVLLPADFLNVLLLLATKERAASQIIRDLLEVSMNHLLVVAFNVSRKSL